ncbi:NAD(P)H-quinone oxidoreductase [Sphingobacterium sp. SRCM116780]|uniref:NAD(P)H-quinone oxidoreductase n=1 Tax=Sphingobacterium sp. SRCM116780 TaxID=2907623 RepID=UPI001F20D44B|nr:NAD(P)H-quinone oxidoreductase [Sphingobacterium sp. SRCM116780]UIR57473.1 NAD(P)H-quinone oxidoreductase [Sphingobacterium sp. SRCM116780]
MRAVVITSFGGPECLQVLDVEKPSCDDYEVLIAVKAAGMNRPDVFQRKGHYTAPDGVPANIPGLEVSGEIVAVGDLVDEWQIGDQVCALLAGGGYAEYVAVNQGQCLPIPKGFTYTEAAALPETLFTVYHNVFQRGALKKEDNFLVHGGSGGIGSMAIQLAKLAGAKVYTTVGSSVKANYCVHLGADIVINYKEQEFEKVIGDSQIDVILDSIGGDYFPKNIQVLKPDSHLIYINAMKGGKVELNLFVLMQKRIYLSGSLLRSRSISFKKGLRDEIVKQIFPLLEKGLFKTTIYRTFTLEDASNAHALLDSGDFMGKLLFVL